MVLRTFLLATAGIFALGSFVVASPAAAQTGEFDIFLNGARVGNASYSFTSTAQGYDSTSIVRVALQGLDYSLSKTETLTSANQLVHVLLSAVVNRQAVTATADPQDGQVVLAIAASGRKTTTRLAAHPTAVMMPDFDPGALETLLALAVEHNNRDLWAIIPKKTGSVEPVQLTTYADEQGTLDGNTVAVHHLVATIAGTKADLFSGADNRLLQAELPQQGFALVRTGFVLKPPAHAPAPPTQ